MRILRLATCLLASVGLCCGLSGCARKGWLRPVTPSKVQTVASVGDKSLPIVAGTPGTGTTQSAGAEPLDPPRRSGSRISGRVFDDRGKPVPNARVRLVVGGAPAGRDTYATTDRSGAFTMHGLRAGRYYTLVAESQTDGVRLSGRMEARAPRTGVRIEMGDRPGTSAASRGPSVRPVRSRRTRPDDEHGLNGVDDEEFPRALSPDGAFQGKGNIDQLGPPADEAASRSPWEGRSARPRVARTSATTRPSVSDDEWETSQDQRPSSYDGRSSRSSRQVLNDSRNYDDDGENPLPPAIETASRDDRFERGAERGQARDLAEPGPLFIPDGALPVRERVGTGAGATTRGRVASVEPQDDWARTGVARQRGRNAKQAFNAEDLQESAVSASRTADQGRPTWRDLSINSSQVPIDEAVGRSSAVLPAGPRGDEVVLARLPRGNDDAIDGGLDRDNESSAESSAPVRRAVEKSADDFRMDRDDRPSQGDERPEIDRGPRSDVEAQGPEAATNRRPTIPSRERPRRAARPNTPFCQLDTTDRRVEDFQLLGLDGSMVGFQDVDSDVIVLDFWGSWCEEHCRKSIEFERSLKERYGADRVRVLGIACEKGKTQAERRASAAAAAMQLGINYPVLVSSMDGACPVQKAFQVQFYPTFVVLDRSGRILRVERGATDATLSRIDRAVSAALDEADEQAL